MRTRFSIIKQLWIVCLSILILPLQGCLEDDLSVCGISVNFVYTKNVDEKDKFATNVDKINLYVFDSEGFFLTEYSEEGSRLHSGPIPLNLSPGVYDLIAWGNLCEDYEIPVFERGVTHINDVILSLKRAKENTVPTHPKDLYHGALQQLVVDAGLQTNQIFKIELTKNTNNILVTTKGLPTNTESKASGTIYDCSIVSRNGDYKFDNSITGTDRLQYIPESSLNEERELKSDFVIMRELNDNVTGSRILLTRTEEGKDPVNIVDTELVPILIPAAITGDLDIDDEFEIEIEIVETNGTTTIYINGWEYTTSGGTV